MKRVSALMHRVALGLFVATLSVSLLMFLDLYQRSLVRAQARLDQLLIERSFAQRFMQSDALNAWRVEQQPMRLVFDLNQADLVLYEREGYLYELVVLKGQHPSGLGERIAPIQALRFEQSDQALIIHYLDANAQAHQLRFVSRVGLAP